MKPYITDSFKNGKFVLKFQYEGQNSGHIKETLQGAAVVAYAMPEGHSFQSAWLFQLFFNNGYLVEFSSASTEVGGWQEMGSLNLRFDRPAFDQKNIGPCIKTEVESLCVNAIEYLIYEDANVYGECGIAFCDSAGKEILIAAGVSPGSVSIQAPFSVGEFQPEFPLTDYRREPMSPTQR